MSVVSLLSQVVKIPNRRPSSPSPLPVSRSRSKLSSCVGGRAGWSWYLSKMEIERGSLSSQNGVGAGKEAQLPASYCSFARDVRINLVLRCPSTRRRHTVTNCSKFAAPPSPVKPTAPPPLLRPQPTSARSTAFRVVAPSPTYSAASHHIPSSSSLFCCS